MTKRLRKQPLGGGCGRGMCEATALIYNKSPTKSKNDTNLMSKPIIEHAHKSCDDLYQNIDHALA